MQPKRGAPQVPWRGTEIDPSAGRAPCSGRSASSPRYRRAMVARPVGISESGELPRYFGLRFFKRSISDLRNYLHDFLQDRAAKRCYVYACCFASRVSCSFLSRSRAHGRSCGWSRCRRSPPRESGSTSPHTRHSCRRPAPGKCSRGECPSACRLCRHPARSFESLLPDARPSNTSGLG